MSATGTMLDIAGGVGLLLWGTHMVTTGLMRGFGATLRGWLARGLRHPASAFAVGIGVTALLQSSTATALMVSSFAARGLVEVAAGLAVMLGANVGTALVTQALSFNVAAAGPILILGGVLVFRWNRDEAAVRNVGRAAVGLGLMLLALTSLVRALAPVEAAPALRALLGALANAPLVALALGALLTWACHSSVAIVLLIVSLAASGAANADLSLALVLGANVGSAFAPLLAADSPAARRIPLGNLIMRAVGCLLVLPFTEPIAELLAHLGARGAAHLVVNFHLAFNLALALIFLPLAGPTAVILKRFLPDPAQADDAGRPRHLNAAALASPEAALADATLEAIRMAEMAAGMLKGALVVFRTGERSLAREIGKTEAALDRLGSAVRHYLADLGGGEVPLSDSDGERAQEILSFALNIEHIADIVSNNLLEFAARRIKQTGQPFTADELSDIESLHAELLQSFQLGLTVFLRDDERSARRLAPRKALMWRLERQASERHFRCIHETGAANVEATTLYLRILRDLRRVHSHIAAWAYPAFERHGLVRGSGTPGDGPVSVNSDVDAPSEDDSGDAPRALSSGSPNQQQQAL
jgi:phosphate:Na+ symporter